MPITRQHGHPKGPSSEQISRYAHHFGMDMSAEEIRRFAEIVTARMAAFEVIEALPEPAVALRHPHRDPGHVPTESEDPYNAFVRICEVRGAPSGPLAGKTVAVKDCIGVAGVPVTDGGRRMPYLVPTEDAVVVERLLDAGATIVGKTNMDDLAAGYGEGSHFGAARNPHNPRFSTGGSSSGSGAAVAAGMADIALGADEGGSVRIPAAWCGLVGMKATHGLVPSYGMSYVDHTIDHIGPMTTTVEENARVLQVIAGADWRDPQWVRSEPVAGDYLAAAGQGVDGLRIGVVQESLAPAGTTPDVLECFEAGRRRLEERGATFVPVSIPLWSHSATIFMGCMPLALYGMWFTNGQGFGHMGRVDANAVATAAAHNRLGIDDFPPIVTSMLLTALHLRERYLGTHFAKVQNLRLELRRTISEALSDVDLLMTPTTPMVAFELLDRKGTLEDRLTRPGRSASTNTFPLDLSGHPALTVPGGRGEHDLPVGLQIIGRHFDEPLVYRAGFALEEACEPSWPAGSTAPSAPGATPRDERR